MPSNFNLIYSFNAVFLIAILTNLARNLFIFKVKVKKVLDIYLIILLFRKVEVDLQLVFDFVGGFYIK
jgi:hypothetical protein